MTMIEEIVASLTDELSNEKTFDADILQIKVEEAYREVKSLLRIPRSADAEKIDSYMSNYYSVVRNVALYDYCKIGAEGEGRHDENGTTREWVDRRTLFVGLIPFGHR